MPVKLPAITAKRSVVVASSAAIVLAVGGGAVYALNRDPSVKLDVDGTTRTVSTGAATVGSLLSQRGISLRADDTVSPSKSTKVSSGQKITVRYAKPVTVVVDGKSTDDITHAVTVGGLLKELKVTPAANAFLSAKKSSHVNRNGEQVIVSNPKKISVTADGTTRSIDTTVPTVQEALSTAGIKLGKIDEVTPAVDDFLTANATVKVVRIKKVIETETSAIAFATTVQKDGTLYTGDTKVVTKGTAGQQSTKVELTYADGKVIAKQVISRSTVRPPVSQVEKHGTKSKPSTSDSSNSDSTAASSSDSGGDGVWDRLAKCESGGNWQTNTGNGYYGGLQFSLSTWEAVGGSGLPSNASKAEQIKRAKILQAKAGWGQWSCASIIGLI